MQKHQIGFIHEFSNNTFNPSTYDNNNTRQNTRQLCDELLNSNSENNTETITKGKKFHILKILKKKV